MSTLASVIIYDVIGSRPAFGIPGRLFFASDTGAQYYDTGSAWVSIGSPSGLVLLDTKTASSSAELDFTGDITSGYDNYMIQVEQLIPATAAQRLLIQCSTDGGSTYDTGANYTWAHHYSLAVSSGGDEGSTGDSGMQFGATQIEDGSTSTTKGGTSGFMYLHNPLSAASYKYFNGEASGFDHRDAFMNWRGMGGAYKSATAVDAFRLIMTSGNITSGIVRLYGLSN